MGDSARSQPGGFTRVIVAAGDLDKASSQLPQSLAFLPSS